ncbi:MAG: hypothetical protein OJJ54_00990 [Pseudonocardia sp.]|nr:hypothetical protein [Pseudonocardia sp.]
MKRSATSSSTPMIPGQRGPSDRTIDEVLGLRPAPASALVGAPDGFWFASRIHSGEPTGDVVFRTGS